MTFSRTYSEESAVPFIWSLDTVEDAVLLSEETKLLGDVESVPVGDKTLLGAVELASWYVIFLVGDVTLLPRSDVVVLVVMPWSDLVVLVVSKELTVVVWTYL